MPDFVNSRLFGEAPVRREVCFDSDNGFYAGRPGFFVEFDGAVKIAVVGKSDDAHAKLFGTVHQVVDFGETVEQRVMAMYVQMDEFHVINDNYSGRK